jgi:hypothetical protein
MSIRRQHPQATTDTRVTLACSTARRPDPGRYGCRAAVVLARWPPWLTLLTAGSPPSEGPAARRVLVGRLPAQDLGFIIGAHGPPKLACAPAVLPAQFRRWCRGPGRRSGPRSRKCAAAGSCLRKGARLLRLRRTRLRRVYGGVGGSWGLRPAARGLESPGRASAGGDLRRGRQRCGAVCGRVVYWVRRP